MERKLTTETGPRTSVLLRATKIVQPVGNTVLVTRSITTCILLLVRHICCTSINQLYLLRKNIIFNGVFLLFLASNV